MEQDQQKFLVIFDRDGTLIVEKDYLADPARVEFLPEVVPALKLLAQHGAVFVIASNQSGVGRGYFSADDARAVNAQLHRLLDDQGIVLAHSYFCPHAPDDGCRCRKPQPFMLQRAMQDVGIAADHAFMVGDKVSDIEAGKTAGVKSILLRTGYGSTVDTSSNPADFVAADMAAAAEWILDAIRKPG